MPLITTNLAVAMREAKETTLSRVDHPDTLRLDGRELVLIVDPVLDPLTKGDALFGWEGDARLALYVDGKARKWVLMRLEVDGVYRSVCETAYGADGFGPIDLIGHLLRFLVTHDTRRGYDPIASTMASRAAWEAERNRQVGDWQEHIADKLHWALRKDGALNYVTGA